MLYLVATPIGNLKDISLRALETLESADYIFCEDTRVSGKLLKHYDIKNKLSSYHEHSSKTKLDEILNLLKENKTIAYISDAGMPCISDPGKELVKLAIENNIEYTIIPGASAVVSAYAISNLANKRFSFVGFLDRNKFKSELAELKNINHPIIIYEAPHRVAKLLTEILNILGDRKITIARELSKLHESFLHGNVSEILEHDQIKNPKGEFVLVLEGCQQSEENLANEEILKLAQKRLAYGEKLSAIAKDLAKMGNLTRNDIYKALSN